MSAAFGSVDLDALAHAGESVHVITRESGLEVFADVTEPLDDSGLFVLAPWGVRDAALAFRLSDVTHASRCSIGPSRRRRRIEGEQIARYSVRRNHSKNAEST